MVKRSVKEIEQEIQECQDKKWELIHLYYVPETSHWRDRDVVNEVNRIFRHIRNLYLELERTKICIERDNMDYIVKETKIWIVPNCKSKEEAESRVMYNLRAVLDDHIIEVMENHIGKWAAFRQEGMESVLHGKVIKQKENLLTIKCKNGCKRWVMSKNIIGFYDDKQECYAVR